MIDNIIELRKQLHQYPEISGQETHTALRIQEFINKHHPPKRWITKLGGTGIAAVYEFPGEGPVVAVRCELDALPIRETNIFPHRSKNQNVSHKCGHDGHMAIVAGLVYRLRSKPPKKGAVILLFQPAEETGKGAPSVLEDPQFTGLAIDYIFALHNIPGVPMHTIITMDRTFSAEVISFSLALKGKESHAAEPEQGINPALCISELIADLEKLNKTDPNDSNFTILTPVHINLGQKAYGVSPGYGELHYTLRTWSSDQMENLITEIKKKINSICTQYHVSFELSWFEHFPSSKNHSLCNTLVKDAAKTLGLFIQERPYPFRFGEDFGWYSKKYKTAMFGLGSGEQTPALHHADYDFPDELLETGIDMFVSILTMILTSDE